jgi:SAM-dependent methyltransferase
MSSKQDTFTDPAYLIGRQYSDSTNLGARIALHERYSTNPLPWHRWLFNRLGLRGGERVLEVGCGPANLWRNNGDRAPAIDAVLSDLSPGMAREARRALDASVCVADAQRLPFRDGTFDVVVANHMLYHVPDRDRAICELRRVLRSAGRLVAATNGRAHLRELDELMERFLGRARGHDDAEKFGLETGAGQLQKHFRSVDVHRYPDELLVTETEPLLGYILSIEDDIDQEAIGRLRAYVEERIAADGRFAIAKDAGVLIALT